MPRASRGAFSSTTLGSAGVWIGQAIASHSSCCVLCDGEVPTSEVPIYSIGALRPADAAPAGDRSAVAIDMDTVSHIGNTTHKRYFAYVGECYHMRGSVYYLSIFGQAPASVSFTTGT